MVISLIAWSSLIRDRYPSQPETRPRRHPVVIPSKRAVDFLKYVKPSIVSPANRTILVALLVEFDRVWRGVHGLDYVTHGGTVLGAYRHAGIIPYDDDVDVAVHVKYRATFEERLKESSLTAITIGPCRRVFFKNESLSVRTAVARWPYVDVLFFNVRTDGKELRFIGAATKGPFSDFFPVNYLPFEGIFIRVPRCVKQFLIQERTPFFETVCCSHFYNHNKDVFQRSRKCISCQELYGMFRFTTWLQINSTHAQQMVMPEARKTYAPLSWDHGMILPIPMCD